MSTTLIIGLIVFSLAYFLALFLVLNRARKVADQSSRATSRIEEFFVSGRDLRLGRAIATLGATEIGLITIAYNAQKGFNEGFSAFHIGIAALVGCGLVGLTGFVVTPLRREKVLTIPEYYGKRYGKDVRILGATVMALGGILNMGLFLKVASLFILALLGIEGPSWTVTAMMVGLVAVAVAYTCFGGMRSVIATDVFQFIIMTVALIGAAVLLVWLIGLDATIEAVSRNKGEAGFNPVVNDNFGIDYIMWMVFVAGVVSSAIWPTALSRALCIERSEDVAKTYLISSFVFMGRMVLPAFLGVMAIAYFNAPPTDLAGVTGTAATSLPPSGTLPSSYGDDADLVATPLMLGQLLPELIVAFFAIAMFASFMSTQDGYLFCWSSIISRDIIGPLTGRSDDADFQIFATRIGIGLIALYELYWGLIYAGKEDIWDYIAVSGSIYFCSGVILLAGGLYWRGATRRGALWCLGAGFTAILALGPVKEAAGLGHFSGPQIGFATIALCAAAFVIGSLTDRGHRRDGLTGGSTAEQ